MIRDFVERVRAGEVDLIDHTKEALREAQEHDRLYHCFTHIAQEEALAQAGELQSRLDQGEDPGPLVGVIVTVKDGICVKGMPSEASSKILRGYRPLFDATAVQRLREGGAIILGKTIQDEFGFGAFGTRHADDRLSPCNPNDPSRVTGGSSAGAGVAAKVLTAPHIAVGESTGGSIVNPAAFCGVVGLCPTYGRVSRYGIIDYANSLDKIGPLARTVSDAALALEVMQGFDVQDSTSVAKEDTYDLARECKGLRVGILTAEVDPRVQSCVNQARRTLESQGVATKEVRIPSLRHALSAYYLLATAEASTNLAKYCGLRYGTAPPLETSPDAYFRKARADFGDEVKRRILLGTFARMAGHRDAYYKKAAQVRTLIIEEYQQAFREVDVLLSPTMPMVAPKFEEVDQLSLTQEYMMDQLTVGPNLAGLPHLTVPIGAVDGMPVGATIIGPQFQEQNVLLIGRGLE